MCTVLIELRAILAISASVRKQPSWDGETASREEMGSLDQAKRSFFVRTEMEKTSLGGRAHSVPWVVRRWRGGVARSDGWPLNNAGLGV